MNSIKWDFYSFLYNPILTLLENERKKIYHNLSLNPDKPLNVYIPGCGTGLDFFYLPANSQILAVDFSEKMLQKATLAAEKLLYPPYLLKIHLQKNDVSISKLPDNSQDLVILHLILAVVEQPELLLNEAIRILKPNGIISIWDKFLPDHQQASFIRRGLNRITTKLATSINLQSGPLLVHLPVQTVHYEFRLAKFMQHIILQKK